MSFFIDSCNTRAKSETNEPVNGRSTFLRTGMNRLVLRCFCPVIPTKVDLNWPSLICLKNKTIGSHWTIFCSSFVQILFCTSKKLDLQFKILKIRNSRGLSEIGYLLIKKYFFFINVNSIERIFIVHLIYFFRKVW